MSRSYKLNDYKKHSEGTNKHHCVNKSCGGRSVEDNLVELKIRTHQAIHELFGNKLPHEILINLLNTICKPFNDDLKAELLDVLNKYRGKEYKDNTYSGKQPRRGPNSGCLFIS